ncbi:hypothetical protein GCM10010145_04860 [Streptomyces ruber]|uniref:Putative restriction endonuclease domain-containing protein n=2 Tax=Streptomyces TaxID=1883 RepID=A0A918EQN5_9ACTN|nr:hypothetical protein GCM10010145_04860 [Streptomyces ruber]
MREMTVRPDPRNRPEPDVLVFPVDANAGPAQTWYEPEGILLAVEVVSPDSRERDREVKPASTRRPGCGTSGGSSRTANKGLPVGYVHELDPATKSYALTGVFRDRLKVSVPYDIDIDIDLTAIGRRPGA